MKITRLITCPRCNGMGVVQKKIVDERDRDRQHDREPCENCNGTGKVVDAGNYTDNLSNIRKRG